MAGTDRQRLHDVFFGLRQDDAHRHDLVDAGVGGVQGPADAVEAHLAAEGVGEVVLHVVRVSGGWKFDTVHGLSDRRLRFTPTP